MPTGYKKDGSFAGKVFQKGHKRSQESEIKRLESRKGYKHKKEIREKISNSLKNHPCYKNEERGQNISKAKKGKPQTREYIDKRIAASLKVICQRPNNFEKECLSYLDSLYPGRFAYTGDGTCIINGKSADAIDVHSKTVALFNGVYWHLERKGFQITEKDKRLVEQFESEPFIRAGYRVIFLWEDEVLQKEGL